MQLLFFSGLVTYYIEGPAEDRRNLMETPLGKAQHSYGIRGNIFSFLLPWEKVLTQLFDKVEDGDLSDWPLSPSTVLNVVRVRFVRGPQSLVDKFRDLHVRSKVVKQLASLYIERKVADLAGRPGVLKIHTFQRCATVAASLNKHAASRIDEFYPDAVHGSETGGLLPGLLEIVRDQVSRSDETDDLPQVGENSAMSFPARTLSKADSAFDQKQSVGHDLPRSTEALFSGVRPSLGSTDSASSGTFAPEVIAEHAVDNVLNMSVRMSNCFEDQFVSKYMPRVFPWALNYDCGGAEYPDLFSKWEELL